MRASQFNFDLPDELIAQQPLARRTASRLLYLDGETGERRDMKFDQLADLLEPDDLLVFNDTRVIPARLLGHKDSGGKIECLVERILAPRRALVQLRASKSPKAGSRFEIEDGRTLLVQGRQEEFYEIEFPDDVLKVLNDCGHVPLPPYIQRADDDDDQERYQTVFANQPGAVAAPTAGLHFDEQMLAALNAGGIQICYLTLHVGAGTFQPVRADDIADHVMHFERYRVNDDVVEAIAETRRRQGRVVAVGTTVVRVLETLASKGELLAGEGETGIFIYPGYEFRCVDAMLTNFHLPQSTLLMLVCAFAGMENVLSAYNHAVEHNYRFFSYGDAMFVAPRASQVLK